MARDSAPGRLPGSPAQWQRPLIRGCTDDDELSRKPAHAVPNWQAPASGCVLSQLSNFASNRNAELLFVHERNPREVDPSEAGFETAENTHFTYQAAA